MRPDRRIPTPRPSKPSATDFRSAFPEFSATEDALVTAAINTAYGMHSAKRLATLALTAHLLVVMNEDDISEPDGGSGEVTGETSVGNKISQYRVMADSGPEVFFTRTSYGRAFLTLEKRTARRGISAIVG